MLFGYIRPTHDDSDLSIQLQHLSNIEGITIFQEEHDSAKKRIALKKIMETLKKDDQVIVYKLYSLADSTRHLVDILDYIEHKGASIYSIAEDVDTSRKEGYSFNHIVRKLVDFQSDVISEKTKSGLNEAQKRGNHAGRPRKPDANVKKAILMHGSKKYTLTEIKEATGISKSTLYRSLEN